MKQSSLTAYYTDPMIIRQIWQKLLDDGFEGGRILDPSMGLGTSLRLCLEVYEINQNSMGLN